MHSATSGWGGTKHIKCLNFDQVLVLLPYLEDRETQNNLSTQRNDEAEANKSQEEARGTASK